jgi:hypothetical protein
MGSGSAVSRYAKLESDAAAANDDFIDDQAMQQEVIIREQDSQLGEVAQTLGSLRSMGQAIGDELEDQNRSVQSQTLSSFFQPTLSATPTRLPFASRRPPLATALRATFTNFVSSSCGLRVAKLPTY